MSMRQFQGRLLERAFDNESYKYTLNEGYADVRVIDGLVTNPTITNKGNLHFHSRTLFKRGDMLKVGENYYLINSDVLRLRGAKYKGMAYYCNWNYTINIIERVRVGTDALGRPEYQDVIVGTKLERGILSFEEVAISSSSSIIVSTMTYELIVKDTKENRELLAINKTIDIGGRKYAVNNIAYDKDGLLTIRFRNDA